MEVDSIPRRRAAEGTEAQIRPYALHSYPGACWSPLNETPHKNSHCHCVRCSEALSVLVGRARLLGGHWDARMSGEQLAHSEQTAALQATLSISSQPSSPAPTNTRRRLGSVSSPSSSSVVLPLCPLAAFSVWIL